MVSSTVWRQDAGMLVAALEKRELNTFHMRTSVNSGRHYLLLRLDGTYQGVSSVLKGGI